MKVIAFTSGENDPSRRFRLAQHKDELRQYDINIKEVYSKYGAYPPASNRLGWGMKNLGIIAKYPYIARDYDIAFLQRTFISRIRTFENMLNIPRIFDVDDAIYVKGNYTDKIAYKSQAVICGNDILAQYYEKFNKNIYIIPTAVDVRKFTPKKIKEKEEKFIIGWSGTSSNLTYLYEIEDELDKVVRAHDNIQLKIISNQKPNFKRIPDEKIEFVKWSSENEVKELQDFSVGIMPLANTEWEQGKCSFKMLTYMACEIPVVVSEVGMNSKVLRMGECGIGIKQNSQWSTALLDIYNNEKECYKMGKVGRKIIKNNFSIQVISSQLEKVINSL